jgi:uncharacterized protein YbaP (TraB family)
MRISRKIFPGLLILIVAVMPALSSAGSHTFLFRLEHEGVNTYLLGSVHMLKKEHYPLPEVITEAFDKSEVLGVEADLLNIDQFGLQSKIMKIGRYPESETLKDNIPETLHRKTSALLKEIGLAMDFFNSFKPWFVAVSIQGFQLVKLGYNPQLGIDMVFLKKARERKMPVVELEGPMFQIELLEGFTEEEQIDFLKSTVIEMEELPKMVDEIIAAWQEGNTEAIEELMGTGYDDLTRGDSLKMKFIDDRNLRMTERILEWVRDGRSYFIIVGAGHLVGEKGIISLLRKEGYDCTQL